MRSLLYLSITCLLALAIPARAAAPPIVLSVSLSTDRPALGSELLATVVVFADTPQDVAVDAAGQAVTIHCTPVGLAVVRIGAGAVVGPRVLRFSAGGQVVERQIYVGTFAWPRATFGMKRWMPIIRR